MGLRKEMQLPTVQDWHFKLTNAPAREEIRFLKYAGGPGGWTSPEWIYTGLPGFASSPLNASNITEVAVSPALQTIFPASPTLIAHLLIFFSLLLFLVSVSWCRWSVCFFIHLAGTVLLLCCPKTFHVTHMHPKRQPPCWVRLFPFTVFKSHFKKNTALCAEVAFWPHYHVFHSHLQLRKSLGKRNNASQGIRGENDLQFMEGTACLNLEEGTNCCLQESTDYNGGHPVPKIDIERSVPL